MNISTPISSQISSISFSYLHSSDVRRMSVKQVVNPVLFDNLNNPNAGGMYDPVFGPRGSGDVYVALSSGKLQLQQAANAERFAAA